jgi:hypothetical protein
MAAHDISISSRSAASVAGMDKVCNQWCQWLAILALEEYGLFLFWSLPPVFPTFIVINFLEQLGLYDIFWP